MAENERCKIPWDMITQGDRVIEARRPGIVVVEKTVTRQLSWILLHRGITESMKRSEKIDKYQDFKRRLENYVVSDSRK